MGTSLTRPRVTDQLRFVDGPPSISWSPPMIPTRFLGEDATQKFWKSTSVAPKKAATEHQWSVYTREVQKKTHMSCLHLFLDTFQASPILDGDWWSPFLFFISVLLMAVDHEFPPNAECCFNFQSLHPPRLGLRETLQEPPCILDMFKSNVYWLSF